MTIIEDLIAQDNSHLTKVYALYKQGLSAKEASQALEHKNAMNTTVNYYVLDVLLGRRNASELKHDSLKIFNGFVKRNKDQLPKELLPEEQETSLEPEALIHELSSVAVVASVVTPQASGIYVYSYPTFLTTAAFKNEAPLIKIGMSGSNVQKRLARQESKTEVPEAIEVLWSFETDDALKLEKQLHAILHLFGRWRKTAGSGSEWFQAEVNEVQKLVEQLTL